MLTAGVWFLAFSVAILAIMLAPWAINEADKIKDDEDGDTEAHTKGTST